MHNLHFLPLVGTTTIPRYVGETAGPFESTILAQRNADKFLCKTVTLLLHIPPVFADPFSIRGGKNVNNHFCNLYTKFYSPPNSPAGPFLREM